MKAAFEQDLNGFGGNWGETISPHYPLLFQAGA